MIWCKKTVNRTISGSLVDSLQRNRTG